MKFTRRTDCALRIMEFLLRQKENEPCSVKSMSEKIGITVKFLQSVVGSLTHAGLLKTRSGPKGGVYLSRLSGQISLLEVVESVEGKINLMDCFDEPHNCESFQGCSIMRVMIEAQDAMVNYLKNTTLDRMLHTHSDPFKRVPAGHYQKPIAACPIVKSSTPKKPSK